MTFETSAGKREIFWFN